MENSSNHRRQDSSVNHPGNDVKSQAEGIGSALSADTWQFAPLIRNHYRAIVIDMPIRFSGGTKGRPQHYRRMKDAEIASLPVAELCHREGAHIFAWMWPPYFERFFLKIWPHWKAQGLRWSSRASIWVKMQESLNGLPPPLFIHRQAIHMTTGYTWRKETEDLFLLKIGKPKRLRADIRELIFAPIRAHSQKPDEIYERIEQYCAGPYLDLFSREDRPGWDVWGDEIGKLNARHPSR